MKRSITVLICFVIVLNLLNIGVIYPVNASASDPYLDVFFDKTLSEIKQENNDKFKVETPLRTGHVSITLKKQMWQDIIDELEEEKDLIGNDYSLFRKKFLKHLVCKLNLQYIFDSHSEYYDHLELDLYESTYDFKKYNGYLVDYCPFDDHDLYDCFYKDEIWQFEFNFHDIVESTETYPEYLTVNYSDTEQRKISYKEAAYRTIYLIRKYLAPEYYAEVHSDINMGIPSTVKGDLDQNETVDITDLTKLSLILIGDEIITENCFYASDMDDDDMITLADLAMFRQYLSKKIDSLG